MELYSVREVAELCGVTARTVQKWASENDVKKLGNAFILTKKDIERFLQRPKVGRPPEK
ncbi:MAG: helix-turn-helix domain-containing protein [Treponemataceae bacterium]